MILALKALHIAAIAVWAGGLIALPPLLRRDVELPDHAASVRLHHFSRLAYDGLVSPAAILAVATGIGLIFSGIELGAWLFLKLFAVAGMGGTHMMIGRVLDRLEAPETKPTGRWRVALQAAAAVFAGIVLWMVLARPVFDTGLFPGWLREGQDGALPLIDSASVRDTPVSPPSSSSGVMAMPT